MTVSATTRRAGPFTGNGVTTSFPFTFKTFDTEDVAVTLTGTDALESTLVLDSDYSITLNGDQDASPGGSITYPISGTPLAVGEKLTAVGAVPYDQTADLPTGGSFSPVVIENALDRATNQIQQLAEQAGRALTVAPAYGAIDNVLPAPETSKAIGWNEAGTALVNYSPSDFATVVVNGTSYTDIFNGTGAQVAFVLTANPGSVNALDIAISGVSQVNGVDFTVSGSTLTFTSAPPVATGNICVRYVAALPVGVANAQDIVFDPASGTQTTVEAKLREFVSIIDKGAVGGGADDSAAFYAAAVTGKRVFVPAGVWLCNVLNLPSNTYFFGEGESSIITPYSVIARGALGCNSGSSSAFIEGLTLRDLKFLGTVAADGFYEQAHLLFLGGIKRALIERCYFTGFRGDGLYIGSGVSPQERHNVDVIVRNCTFDGVNNDNRNGISVIDADGLVIEGCTFKNISKSTMPGSIDLEPDQSFGVIKNVTITNCNFSACNGNRGHVTISCGNTVNLQKVSISNNKFSGNTAVYINTETAITGGTLPTVPHQILIDNNIALECEYFLRQVNGSIFGMQVIGNVSYAATANYGRISFGTNTSTPTKKDVTIAENQFSCNINIGVVLYDNWENCTINNNTFRGSTQYHMRLGGTGAGETSTNIAIHDNTFLGSPSSGVVLHQFDTKNPTTNLWRNNYAPTGVTHGFSATRTDFTGSTIDVYGTAALPNSFPYGVHKSVITAASVIGAGTDYGMLTTYAESSYGAAYTWQEFKPATAPDKAKKMHRTAASATTWNAWYTVTGV